MIMAVHFLRHLKTTNNAEKILSGRIETDILPGENIIIPDKCKPFDVIYCSTSNRCRKTLDLLPEELKKGKTIYSDRLLERKLGVLEGLPRAVAIGMFPSLFEGSNLRINAVIPKGERVSDVIIRTKLILDEIEKNYAEKNVLICSHNQTLKIMNAKLTNTKITDDYWAKTNYPNGSIVKIK